MKEQTWTAGSTSDFHLLNRTRKLSSLVPGLEHHFKKDLSITMGHKSFEKASARGVKTGKTDLGRW